MVRSSNVHCVGFGLLKQLAMVLKSFCILYTGGFGRLVHALGPNIAKRSEPHISVLQKDAGHASAAPTAPDQANANDVVCAQDARVRGRRRP